MGHLSILGTLFLRYRNKDDIAATTDYVLYISQLFSKAVFLSQF